MRLVLLSLISLGITEDGFKSVSPVGGTCNSNYNVHFILYHKSLVVVLNLFIRVGLGAGYIFFCDQKPITGD